MGSVDHMRLGAADIGEKRAQFVPAPAKCRLVEFDQAHGIVSSAGRTSSSPAYA